MAPHSKQVLAIGWQVFARLDGRVLGQTTDVLDAIRALRDARDAGVLADVKRVLVATPH